MTGTRATDGTLERLAAGAFLLLVVALAGPIAPMGITTALAGALTLACLIWGSRRPWPRTPAEIGRASCRERV